jgi:hypothetical protein
MACPRVRRRIRRGLEREKKCWRTRITLATSKTRRGDSSSPCSNTKPTCTVVTSNRSKQQGQRRSVRRAVWRQRSLSGSGNTPAPRADLSATGMRMRR